MKRNDKQNQGEAVAVEAEGSFLEAFAPRKPGAPAPTVESTPGGIDIDAWFRAQATRKAV